MNEQNIFKSKSRVWKILTALYGIFRKHLALQTAEGKQPNSANSLWPWVVKYPLSNGDKPRLGIDREWPRDVYEANGSEFWLWVAVKTAMETEKGQIGVELVGAAPATDRGRKWVV